ncbi:hypothetical protein N7492_003978 [Penicillium capsulatum]|uniref:Nuclear control of ATPase protein 2 n=1 Tax=Penicillium capsulatum TaxID=69766 RepID=A0A9W9IMA7_9EURO|nr:hypothetical protein N7492_003978 [Penicillium capsulatum]KAJ6121446.1 hypothetical protein N7512_003911 [Penicillium capsulatum]
MSIVQENACGVNTQIDRLQQRIVGSEAILSTEAAPSQHVRRLQNVIDSLSVTSKTQSLLSADRLVILLSDPAFSPQPPVTRGVVTEEHVSDYLWLVAAKAAIQASGLVMHTLLDHTLRLQDEIDYWNDMLETSWYSGLYAAQTSPGRLWHWAWDIYSERGSQNPSQVSLTRSIASRWAHFYQIARQSARGMSGHPIRLNLSLPIRSCRAEIRQKRDSLLSMKDIHACSLGLLMEGWHVFQSDDFTSQDSPSPAQWQDTVSKTVLLTEAILQQVIGRSSSVGFEQEVSATMGNDLTTVQMQSKDASPALKPAHLIQRLVSTLQQQLPHHTMSMTSFISHHGRPSGIVRYWLPALAALLTSSASLRILVHRQDEILQWIMSFGSTIIDFGGNWVVEPIRKLIGTIRHDEKSEIAIMSKNSLVADRASLERMVIDFVRDRPDPNQTTFTAADTAAISNAVKEGDLTPVLKAYERDLRAPFSGTVRGDLVRTLLIQIQKTKVDVEVAISGIDSLLKSQELVFGFIGLTPGILVSYATLQYVAGLFSNRRGLQQGKRQHELRRGLRNATRILTSATISDDAISYKDSGRLICETEALLPKARAVLGRIQYQEFREDVQDLLETRGGVNKQLRVMERMRWTYLH